MLSKFIFKVRDPAYWRFYNNMNTIQYLISDVRLSSLILPWIDLDLKIISSSYKVQLFVIFTWESTWNVMTHNSLYELSTENPLKLRYMAADNFLIVIFVKFKFSLAYKNFEFLSRCHHWIKHLKIINVF